MQITSLGLTLSWGRTAFSEATNFCGGCKEYAQDAGYEKSAWTAKHSTNREYHSRRLKRGNMTLPAHSPRLTFPVRESTSPAKGSSEHRVPSCLFDSAHSHRSVLKKVVRYRGELRNIQAPQTRAAGSVSRK